MRVSLKYIKDLNFRAESRHFKNIILDEPKSFHGTDLGPSPIEYLLIGIGGCIGSTLAYCLNKYKIHVKELNISVDGKLRHIGPRMRLQLERINIYINLEICEPYKREDLEACKQDLKSFCPVYYTLVEGIPIDITFS
jgi:putative redox protein